jgi:hypothetical protein
MFKKILFLYERIISNLKDNNANNLNLELGEDKKDIDDVEMEDGNPNKKKVEEKIHNINSFCKDILKCVEEDYNLKKKDVSYKEYTSQNKYEIINQTLTQKQEDELRKQLENYKQSIM